MTVVDFFLVIDCWAALKYTHSWMKSSTKINETDVTPLKLLVVWTIMLIPRGLWLSSFVWNREIYITNKKKNNGRKSHSLKSHHALLIKLVSFFFFTLYLQLFQTSRSPGPESRAKGPKVVVAKPGSYHRPARATGPVIGGHRYWQSQMLQSDSSQQTRSGRSPRRHSPSNRKTDSATPQQQQLPATSQPGLLGLPFSKLNHLKHLRARGATSQKKASQSNKAAR